MTAKHLSLLLCTLCIALAGCDGGTGITPDDGAYDDVLQVSAAEAAALATAPVISWADFTTVTGESALKRAPAGVGMQLRTSQIPAEQAVTIWWVVFNNPAACGTTPCGEADLFVPEVAADILYADGAVLNAAGQGHFDDILREHDTTGSIADVFGLPAASGLHDADAAEVHLVVRSHGPVIPELVEEQITTFGGGCTVDLPPGEMPDAEGECADVQFSIHVAN